MLWCVLDKHKFWDNCKLRDTSKVQTFMGETCHILGTKHSICRKYMPLLITHERIKLIINPQDTETHRNLSFSMFIVSLEIVLLITSHTNQCNYSCIPSRQVYRHFYLKLIWLSIIDPVIVWWPITYWISLGFDRTKDEFQGKGCTRRDVARRFKTLKYWHEVVFFSQQAQNSHINLISNNYITTIV